MCHGICPCLRSTDTCRKTPTLKAYACKEVHSFLHHRGSVARCEVCAGQIAADRRELGLLHISTHALGVIVASRPPCKLQFLLL